MTTIANRAAALAFTTVASALLLIAAVGPASTNPVGAPAAPVAHNGQFMA